MTLSPTRGIVAQNSTGSSGTFPFIISSISTGSANNTSALTSDISTVTGQISGNATFGINSIVMQPGRYTFTGSGTLITSKPYIKLISTGPTLLDFSGAANTCVAFDVNNAGAPSQEFSTYYNSPNFGPFINGFDGGIDIYGPSSSAGSSIGLILGDVSTSPGTNDNVNLTSMAGVSIHNFFEGIHLRTNSLYMMNFIYGGQVAKNTYAIRTDSNSSNTNSGERLSWHGWTFGIGTYGLYVDTPNFDFNFTDCSWDFLDNPITGTSHAIYCKWSFDKCHFEGNKGPMVKRNQPGGSTANSTGMEVDISNSKFVSATSPFNASSYNLFQGPMFLNINNLQLGFPVADYTSSGMFMCDDDVEIVSCKGITHLPSTFKQLISVNTLLNNNSFFANGTASASLASQPTSFGWQPSTNTGATVIVDTSNPWTAEGGTQSLKYTATNSSNSFAIIGDTFPVQPGDRLIANTIVYGGSTSGTGTVKLAFLYSSNNQAQGTTQDATESGDSFATIYSGGARTSLAKQQAGIRFSLVPAGACFAQLVLVPTGFVNGDVIWISFAGVSKI